MAHFLNMSHVEWEGLEIFTGTDGVAQLSIETTPLLLTYSHVLKFTGNAAPGQVSYPLYRDPVSASAPTRFLQNIYLRWTDLTPDTEYRFLSFNVGDTFGPGALYFILKTNGDVQVLDENDATIATITNPFTVNTWHRIQINVKISAISGEVRVLLENTQILANQTGLALSGNNGMKKFHIEGPTASSGNMFFAAAFARDVAASSDIFSTDFKITGPYQAPDATTATPDTGIGNVVGDDLEGSTLWSHSAETPPSDANVSRYDSFPKDGGIFLDSGSRSGPSGDGNIDGNILASQAVLYAKRGLGSVTNHKFVSGNKTDNYDAAETYINAAVIATNKPYYVISSDAGAVPTSSEFGLLGFESDNDRDLIISDMAMFILSVPGAGQSLAIGAASETDITQPLGFALGLGAALETDAALSITIGGDLIAVGSALETDAAIAVARLLGIGIATESDAAPALVRAEAKPISLAVETDTALPVLTGGQAIAISPVLESDAALPLGLALGIGAGQEVDAALALSLLEGLGIGSVAEVDAAVGLTATEALAISIALETDTARGVTIPALAIITGITRIWTARSRGVDWEARSRGTDWEARE